MATRKQATKSSKPARKAKPLANAKPAVNAKPAKLKQAVEVRSRPNAKPAARADASAVSERLSLAIPEPRCELAFQSPFQLLIATILSAQSTDKMVNAVTPELFAQYPTPDALSQASQDDVEVLVKRTGFFRNKAKSIRGTAQKLVDEFGGQVPQSIAQLVTLPGVARKTANVVLGTAYGVNEGFVVDTHIARVAQRLGLSEHTEAGKIEQDLCATFVQPSWSDTGHRLLLHGRYTCLAKAPKCTLCPLNELCESRLSEPTEPSWQERASQEVQRVSQGMASTAA